MREKREKTGVVQKRPESEARTGKVTAWRGDPFEDMERMFESFIPRGWLRPFHWERPFMADFAAMEARLPKVDIIDRDEEVLVKAEIPGVTRDELDVSVEDNTVTIRGTSGHETKEEKGDYYRREIRRGSFSRTVTLPRDVDGTKAKAIFRDGILELTLPKLSKSRRQAVKVE